MHAEIRSEKRTLEKWLVMYIALAVWERAGSFILLKFCLLNAIKCNISLLSQCCFHFA